LTIITPRLPVAYIWPLTTRSTPEEGARAACAI
jgi:hypothetical protein